MILFSNGISYCLHTHTHLCISFFDFLHLISCLSHVLNVLKCVKEPRSMVLSAKGNKLFNPCVVQPPNFPRKSSILGYMVSPHCNVLLMVFTTPTARDVPCLSQYAAVLGTSTLPITIKGNKK